MASVCLVAHKCSDRFLFLQSHNATLSQTDSACLLGLKICFPTFIKILNENGDIFISCAPLLWTAAALCGLRWLWSNYYALLWRNITFNFTSPHDFKKISWEIVSYVYEATLPANLWVFHTEGIRTENRSNLFNEYNILSLKLFYTFSAGY